MNRLLPFSLGLLGLLELHAQAIPLPPKVIVGKDAAGPTNVKVRRLGVLKVDSEPAPPPAVALSGKHHLLVILVEADDAPWPSGFDKTRYEELLFSTSAGSLREYYKENSYGLFEVEGEVVGPVKVPGRMTDYSFQMGDKNDRVEALVKAAVAGVRDRSVFQRADTHDTRGRKKPDGIVDHLLVIYSEKTGAPDGFAPIWPHRSTTDLVMGNVHVTSYLVLNHAAPLGVYAHEFGHDLGLPDLYDRDYTSHGAGSWCLMAAGSWPEEGKAPLHLSAWAKARLGWIVPTVVAKSTSGIKVPSASEKPFALKIPIGAVDAKEYFLVENRRRVGFDKDLPGEGLLIWHIDETKDSNDDEKRKLMDVVESTKLQDLDFIEQGKMPDEAHDVFALGSRTSFSDDTEPSARQNDGSPSNIKLEVKSKPERVMLVDVERPEILNPGGVPFSLENDGYRYGRFATVPTGKGSEALVRLTTTPGGYLVFGAEAFVVGGAGEAKYEIALYADQKGAPGKVLAKASGSSKLGAEGYGWVSLRLGSGPGGMKLGAEEKVWLGFTSADGKTYPALNPESTSGEARFRRKAGGALEASFNFADGEKRVSDYVLRVRGFGFIEGRDRPEPLAGPEDPWVKRMQEADALIDQGRWAEAEKAEAAVYAAMSAEPRRYEGHLASVVSALGLAAYEQKHYPEAKEHFLATLRRAQALSDQAAEADVHQSLCEIAFFSTDYAEARASCSRALAQNERLGRKDRQIEALYYRARAQQKRGQAATEDLDLADTLVGPAFPSDPKEAAEWRSRIDKARRGAPEDEPPPIKERVRDETKKKDEQKTRDLLQFLQDDVEKSGQ
ncbi:MAG: M6 family metalloprotease domain-containing protein [Myxococcota bacterium]